MAGTPRRRPARTGAKGATRRPPTRPGTTGRRHTARGRTGEPKEGTRRRRVVMTTRRWVGLGSVLALLALMLVPTGKSWYDQRQRLDELNEQVAAQEANVDELEREKELWETDEYVEAQARKRLKFVKPGERTYTVVDPDEGTPDVDPETGTVEGEGNRPWYEQMASSVETADDPAGDQ